MINKTLAILAGGKGSRMSYKNKALLIYKDKTFIQNLIEGGENFGEIIIITNDKEAYKDFNLKVVQDIYKEKGPLGGVYTALKNSKYNKVFCIACDMPLLKKETLEKIANVDFNEDILIPKVDGRMQPLCAIYSKTLIEDMEKHLMLNKNKMIDIIEKNNYRILETNLSNIDFYNVNTHEQYNKLEKIEDVYSRNNNK